MFIDDLLADAAHEAGARLALAAADGESTFAGLHAQSTRFAGALQQHTQPGDRVAILAENSTAYVQAYYGVPQAGLLLTPLHHRLHRDEWLATLERSTPTVLIAEPEYLDRLGEGAARRAGVHTVVVTHAVGDTEPGLADVDLPTLLADAPDWTPPTREPDDVAWLIGTSGTTGSPKLAMLTHRSLLAAVEATRYARPIGPDDVLLTPFPLCHVAGYNVLVFHAAARPVVLMRRFDPEELFALVAAHQVTTLSLAPTMIAMLLDHAGRRHADLSSVRALGYGASSIPAEVLRRTVDELGVDLSQGYGMTELSGNAVFLGPDAHRLGGRAAGRPSPGVELQIARETGEILVRAPQVMVGYWNDEASTDAALADGWLHTGDVGRIDEHGDLHVVDRLKDVIVTGGENVASREVEDVLRRHPRVRDAAVIGVPDERWGERVCAVVTIDGDPPVDDAEIVAFVRDRLAGFKVPRVVVFVDELPRNATGKVLKRQLRDELTA